ncbi:MAG: NAD(P)-dependent alcohol dehydrogenase [Polyangiaceae bacterium]|nr:NAD(P)-dependent alcohol dehydrogenase [Polyangiaceae bacterium]
MRVFEITAFGLDNLKVADHPIPELKPGQIRVRIHAASLNFRDVAMCKGHYNRKQALPLIPLADGAGVVDKVGRGVSRFREGDRVAGCFAPDWIDGPPEHKLIRNTLGGPLSGMLADYVILPEQGAVMLPSHLSYREGATLPCAAVTAWNTLTKYRQLKAGDTLLLQGTGGVSIFALQFAKAMGATVIITSSSDEKLKEAASLGADHLINYKTCPDWDQKARKITNKAGVDHIIDVGGGNTFEKSVNCAKVGGFIAVLGAMGGSETPMNLLRVVMNNLTVQGFVVGSRADFEALNEFLGTHQLHPVISDTFRFGDAREAFELMERGEHLGKIVIDFH